MWRHICNILHIDLLLFLVTGDLFYLSCVNLWNNITSATTRAGLPVSPVPLVFFPLRWGVAKFYLRPFGLYLGISCFLLSSPVFQGLDLMPSILPASQGWATPYSALLHPKTSALHLSPCSPGPCTTLHKFHPHQHLPKHRIAQGKLRD